MTRPSTGLDYCSLAGGEVLWSCAQKAGAVNISAGAATRDTYTKHPNLVSPDAFRLDRLTAVTVAGLARQSYFKPTAGWPSGKVGLLTWDDPNYMYAFQHGSLPALRTRGIKVWDVRYIRTSQTLSTFSDTAAAVSNAVLAFKGKGIDHVIIQDGPAGVCDGTCLSLLFLNNARSQKYFPRYGFNSYNSPGTNLLPADQEHGMLAVSWADFIPAQDQGVHPNSRREECFKIMRAHGITVSGDQADADAASACNAFWFIQAALGAATELTVGGVVRAAESLGTSFRSPTVYSTRLGPDQHDGADGVRNSYFDDPCQCMKFFGPPYSSAG